MEMTLKQNVGIDISMDTLDAALIKITIDQEITVVAHKKFTNTQKGFEQLLDWSNKKKQSDSPISFTMEATGVYYEGLAYHLHEQKQTVHVVLPNKAKKFVESLDNKSKTDKLDAISLGQMGAERKLRKWEVMGKSFQNLKRLTRERECVIQERSIIKNQLHAMNHSVHKNSTTIQRSQSRIDFLDDQIKEMEKEIRQVLADDKDLFRKAAKLQTIPGVALITSATIIAETNGFASIENIKQLTSYSGLDIMERQSGKWKGKSKISKKGNSHIRKALYFPAFTIIKKDKNMNNLYLRLKEKKKLSMIAAVAVQRKLLGLMFVVWKNDTEYDPDYYQRNHFEAA